MTGGYLTGMYYDAATGIFQGHRVVASSEEILQANVPEGHILHIGEVDHLSQRMDIATSTIVDHQPPQPTAAHEWDEVAKRWKLSDAAAARHAAHTAALAGIAELEHSQHRAIREAALGLPGAVERLNEIDNKIAALRGDIGG